MRPVPVAPANEKLGITSAAHVILDALWCDQGMAHMLQIFEHEDEFIPDVIALFDFGATLNFISRVLKPAIAAPAVGKVVTALQSQQTSDRQPRLDLVFISHQDDDHWRLLSYLMDELDAQNLAIQVGKIVYTGSDWGNTARGVLRRLATLTANPDEDLVYYGSTGSSYVPANGTPPPHIQYGDVNIYTLIANAPSQFPAKSKERKNGTSAVMVIDYANESLILPGDATWETMAAANALLLSFDESPLPPVTLMSAPHHGSLNTASKDSSSGNDSDFSELEQFIELTKPDAIVVSAGIMNSHRHPHKIVLEKLVKYAGSNDYWPHPVVYYNLTSGEFELASEVELNLYTTVLSLVTPTRVADWHFALSPDEIAVTTATAFYGACKALVSVPDTEENLIDMLISDDPPDHPTGGPSFSRHTHGPLFARQPRANPRSATAIRQTGQSTNSLDGSGPFSNRNLLQARRPHAPMARRVSATTGIPA